MAQHFARSRIHRDGITAGKNLLRPQQVQPGGEGLQPILEITQTLLRLFAETTLRLQENFASLLHKLAGPHTPKTLRQVSARHTTFACPMLDAPQQAGLQIVQALEPLVQSPARMRPGHPLTELREILLFPLESLPNPLP